MSEIIPAILERSFEEIEKKVRMISEVSPFVQVDIVDGVYGKEKTWPFIKGEDENLKKLVQEDQSLPEWESVSYEFDLMVDNPRALADTFVMAGASRIIVHYSSFKDEQEREVFLRDFKKKYNLPEPLSVELGLAIGADINIEEILKYKDTIDLVQLMGIDHVGQQGEIFNEKTIARVAELKKLLPEMTIQIDGGIKEETIKPLVEAGAGRLIIGSTIWNDEDPVDEYEKLSEMV